MNRNTKFPGERPISAPVPGGQLIDYRPPKTTVVLGPRRSNGSGPLGGGNRRINSIGRSVPKQKGV